MYTDFEDEDERITFLPRPVTPRSVLRHRPIPSDVLPIRRGQPRHVHIPDCYEEDERPMPADRRRAAELARPTDEDVEIAPSLRPHRPQQQPKKKRHLLARLLWLPGGILLFVLLFQASMTLPAWYTTTYVDPGQYGPTHGMVLPITLKEGKSLIPAAFLSTNINGQVFIIQLASDPARTFSFVGPNLSILGFPDPDQAEVQLTSPRTGVLQVTIWSDQWEHPFQRYGVRFFLVSDGKGGLKQQGTLISL